jgi:hypothetical protein
LRYSLIHQLMEMVGLYHVQSFIQFTIKAITEPLHLFASVSTWCPPY